MAVEKVRLRIGNLAKAVLVTGQVYRDPKDALNEFVSNAADEYAEAGRRGERIRIVLKRKGKRPVIVIDDVGRRLTSDRLREVAPVSRVRSGKAGPGYVGVAMDRRLQLTVLHRRTRVILSRGHPPGLNAEAGSGYVRVALSDQSERPARSEGRSPPSHSSVRAAACGRSACGTLGRDPASVDDLPSIG